MENSLIRITEVCDNYEVQREFLLHLRDFGLIEFVSREQELYLEAESLTELETILHLHRDLDINLEGIDAIGHLLRRLKEMQKEIVTLRNRGGIL